MSAIQPIRPAATIIIVRQAVSNFEIFMLRRTSKASFAGGMYVFPGGRVEADDHLHKYDEYRTGPNTLQLPQRTALGAEWRGYWIAGIRETFEEAGLLLAYNIDGSLLEFNTVNRVRFADYRDALHAGKLSMLDICENAKLTLAIDRIHFVNRFVTPLGRPRRFDTRFFLAAAPPGQTGWHDDKETVDSIWISPQDALTRNDAEDFDLMKVTRIQLQMLARHDSYAAVLAWSEANETFPVHRPVVPVDA